MKHHSFAVYHKDAPVVLHPDFVAKLNPCATHVVLRRRMWAVKIRIDLGHVDNRSRNV